MKEIHDGTKETLSHWTFLDNIKPVLAVDFDHTITKKCLACDINLKDDKLQTKIELQEGAKEALQSLSKKFKIWIFTGDPTLVTESAGLPNGERYGRKVSDIEQFLTKHDIPYDKVLQVKPPACFIIDDRAIHHKSWKETIQEIIKRMNK